jgi:hypothetical protein
MLSIIHIICAVAACCMVVCELWPWLVCSQNAALFQALPGQLLAPQEAQQAVEQPPGMAMQQEPGAGMPAADAAAAVAEAPAMGMQHPDTLQQGG